jgi:hypothetical protein
MKLAAKTQSQRNPQWGSEILGYNTNSVYNIYNYGCLITSYGNYVDKNPSEINQILKNNNGYTSGSGNFIWSKCSALGLTQTYLSPRYQDVPVSAQAITKIKEFITNGYPLIAEVDFNPATDKPDQHFVLLAGIDDDGNILVVDPWEGQWETWSEDAVKRNVYQFRAYDKTLQKDEQIDLQKELDNCRIERDRNWNWYTGITDILNVGINFDVVIAEVKKLVSLEDQFNQKDKQLEEANIKINELENKLTKLAFEHTELISEHATMTEKMADNLKTMDDQGKQITSLSTAIEELKKQIVAPVRKGWKATLVALIDKL